MLNRFWLNDRGATALEYGFIAGLISIAVVVGATAIGATLSGKIHPLATALS